MSIRHRMLFSFTLMTLLTLLSVAILGLVMAVAITGDFDRVRELYTRQYSMKPLLPEEETAFAEAKFVAKKTPEQLLLPDALASIDAPLPEVQAGLLLRKAETIVYATPALHLQLHGDQLPPYEMANINVRDTWTVNGRFFTYVKFDFSFADQTPGSLYVVRETSPSSEFMAKWFPLLAGLLLLLLLVGNALLYWWVTRGIVIPLRRLKEASEQIREGNLAFEVGVRSSDEIGALSASFEEMRRRLFASVELQHQYEANRKELMTNISHDLKTPMTMIKGYVEGIRDGVARTPEQLDAYLAVISAKTVVMDRLIDDLFLFSKLDLGKVPFAFEPVELRGYMADLVEEMAFDLTERGVALRLHGAEGVPLRVRIDRDKLRRVIVNIVENSAKYMDREQPDKRVEIALADRPGEGGVSIEVADNGPGITAEALPNIFERFYRAEQSRGASTGGSGLGLAIAKQIVREHGGRIEASSTVGRGTTLTITLPKEEAE
ncbi:MAG: HAMP domain-containing histidine kinase [Paenibacillaceae bacterium]|nr:HAMP domain-containing histidine kinase [Paenibacillaceae bacterium]